MTEDDEIKAMQQLAAALGPLDEAARTRVLHWASSRFLTSTAASAANLGPASGTEQRAAPGSQQFETFAELFEAANPSTERERALVAAYWVQIVQGEQSFASQTLNSALKDLGHGVGNITDALSALKEERPALILQLKKSGTSKQARKTYKLTQEGIRRVQSMTLRETSNAA